MIKIKDTEALESLLIQPVHENMLDLLLWVTNRYIVTITQGYEKRDYRSVHSTIPYRGVDIRSWDFKDPQSVADTINDNWQYDPGRPEKLCAVYHDTGRGVHIHLQVHDKTERL